MKYYLKLLRIYLLPHWWLVLLAIICAGIVSVTYGATAWVVKPIIDRVFMEKDKGMLKLVPFMIIGLYFTKGVARFFQNYFMSIASFKMLMGIRLDLHRRLHLMSYSFLKSKSTGELVSRILNDVNVIDNANISAIRNLIRESITLLILVVLVFKRDVGLALISVFVIPLMGYVIYRIGRYIKRNAKKQQERMAEMSGVLIEGFGGAKTVKVFGAEDREINRFKKQLENYYNLAIKAMVAKELNVPIIEFLSSISVAIIVYIGGLKVTEGHMTPGDFFSFITSLMLMYDPISKISTVHTDINSAIAASKRVWEFLSLEPDIKDDPDAIELTEFRDEIRYVDVWFKYPDAEEDEWALKGVNLEIRKNEKIAIVGESGVGKTTLVELLPRLYDVTKGQITIDGIDIRKIKLAFLRNLISVVSQDVFLFNDTVYNNILFGKPDATYEEVVEAAKLAYAHDFIMRLPDGYDTIVGDRGVRLSGGERQRIAIARAILKNAPILILDEATSALDAESETAIRGALYNLMRDKTVLIIAHRLATVIEADRIYVMEGGTIVEEGTHEELISGDTKYRRLCELQFLVKE
ncbi:MAG: ABC transporter ATP-binding protein [Thermosulfidibacteraceae bacterium]|jgi:subfamily B ATP-binding cassette protein MsbA